MENLPTAPYAYPAPVTAPLPVPLPPTFAEPHPRLRMWPVLLTLYFLAPLIAEVLSGSTPPLLFIQPFGFIFTPLLYGSSAILIREIVVRRRLGWGNVLLLGAAFGVFQEALVVQTWYDFIAKSSPSYQPSGYGVVWGTYWPWAVELSFYHAIISIALPLILLNLFFPQRAALPGLRRRGVILWLVWLIVPCGLLAFAVATTQFAKQGYHGPPLGAYLLGCALLVALLLIGSFVRIPTPRPQPDRQAPGVWTVRFAVFGLTTAFFGASILLPDLRVPAIITSLVVTTIGGFGLWRVRTWTARNGWNARHWLAIVMGVLGWFLLLWTPLMEFGQHAPLREGLVLANVIAMALAFILDWRLKRRIARTAPPSVSQPEPIPAAAWAAAPTQSPLS